jgi:serine-type D-Ala-D-Ala carboxypeptidase/endopeptidase (penicillin-binding protein 4)
LTLHRLFPRLRPASWLAAAVLLATAAPRAHGQQFADNVALVPVRSTPARTSAALGQRIDSILARPAMRRADWGVEVRDAQTGELLYGRNADRLFVPASNLKLIVAATAAHHLAPDYRFRTTVYATGPVADGALDGDLVLYGRGDPLISERYGRRRTAVWEALADSLLKRGIRRVTGGVVADESFFDAVRVRGD